MMTSSLSVVVPVFNSQATLPELVQRLRPVVESAPAAEVILVDDGSRDRSWAVICDLAAEHAWLRGIELWWNSGQGNAVLCGIRAARNDVIVTLDDDLQHPPEEIPKLLQKVAEGYDVVYGVPQKERHAFLRAWASRFTKLALQIAMGAETARNVSAFRALRTGVREAFADYRSPFLSIDVLLTWGTRRFGSVPVQHDARHAGTSHYTLRKLVIHALNMITGFSTLPLQLASFVGFTFTLFGLSVLAYVVGRSLVQGVSVSGFTFLASLIAIFSGAQLLALGMIGEYLARMHLRMLGRPGYAVRQQIGRDHEDR